VRTAFVVKTLRLQLETCGLLIHLPNSAA
jgi:hypothetical protein